MSIRIAGYEVTCDYQASQCTATGPTEPTETEARGAAIAEGWDAPLRKRPGIPGETVSGLYVREGQIVSWRMDFCPAHAGTCTCPLTWGCRNKADGPDGLCNECRAEHQPHH